MGVAGSVTIVPHSVSRGTLLSLNYRTTRKHPSRLGISRYNPNPNLGPTKKILGVSVAVLSHPSLSRHIST